jgi:hypothetical protein
VAGSSGVNGATGAVGLVGATGLQGIAGVAGVQGLIGATGLTGAKGETGTAGPAGFTKVVFGRLIFNDISGGAGTGESFRISNFQFGKFYLLRAKIYGYQPNDSTEYFLPLALSVIGSVPGVIAQTSYSLEHGYSSRDGVNRYENSMDIEIVLDGTSAQTNFSVTLIVTSGRNTGGTELVRLAGEFTALEVGAGQNYA